MSQKPHLIVSLGFSPDFYHVVVLRSHAVIIEGPKSGPIWAGPIEESSAVNGIYEFLMIMVVLEVFWLGNQVLKREWPEDPLAERVCCGQNVVFDGL